MIPPKSIPRLVIVAIHPACAPESPNSAMILAIEKERNMTFKSSVPDATMADARARRLFLSSFKLNISYSPF